MKDKLLRLILTFILVISIILAVVAYHAVRNVNRSSEARDWVNHTYTVLRAIEQLQTFHYVAEAGAQVYVATDATPNRDQSNEAIVMISEQIAIIKALTRNAPDQVEQVNAIEMRSNQLVSTLQQILKAQRNGDFAKAQSLLHDHTGSIDSADLDRKIDALHETQLQLLTDRDKESYLQDQAMRWTVWNGIILYVLLMAGVILLTRNHLKARTQAAESLKAAHDSLEERVKERTIELEESNRACHSRTWSANGRINPSNISSITITISWMPSAISSSCSPRRARSPG